MKKISFIIVTLMLLSACGKREPYEQKDLQAPIQKTCLDTATNAKDCE